MSLVCYTVADLISYIPWEVCANMYQKLMTYSYNCDEKIGFDLWKLPKKTK